MTVEISNMPGPCVCVQSSDENPRPSEPVRLKPHDGAVCGRSHTDSSGGNAVAVPVVVVVVVSIMGSNYYPKGSQIPLWDLTLGWFDE